MRFAILLVLLGATVAYALGPARKIDEAGVHRLYRAYSQGMLDEDSAALCRMYDDKFRGHASRPAPGGGVEESLDKAGACESLPRLLELKRRLSEQIGEELYINADYEIRSITLSPNGKKATVEVDTELRIGTEQRLVLLLRATETDTVIRELGREKFLTSDAVLKTAP
ncbi:hypothetical protein [Derxia lacustris]|uniref:hypothetical protein n=1 Tax=Derxia lacustris TaxID=764842 RepID=UPI000A17649A|nr:hypothetical protein [Derxia lacustris]